MFGQLIQAMVKVVDARDLITINNKLSGQWDLSELSYNNVEMNSYKRQKIYDYQPEVNTEKNKQLANDFKLTTNFPWMTKANQK